jgi:hypothetical protein
MMKLWVQHRQAPESWIGLDFAPEGDRSIDLAWPAASPKAYGLEVFDLPFHPVGSKERG